MFPLFQPDCHNFSSMMDSALPLPLGCADASHQLPWTCAPSGSLDGLEPELLLEQEVAHCPNPWKSGFVFHKKLRGGHFFIKRESRGFSLILPLWITIYLIQQNREHYFTRIKTRQMMANIPCREMPEILIRLKDSRSWSLALGFIFYSPELVKMGNFAKKLWDYLRQRKIYSSVF